MLKIILTLITALVFSTAASSADQVISAQPTIQYIASGQTLSIDVAYSTADPSDENLAGLGLRLHWNSSALTFSNITNVLATSLATQGTPEPDSADLDGDPNTDTFIHITWLDTNVNWPGSGTTPATLYSANFTTSIPFTNSTTINFSSSDTAPGYLLDATSATVNVQFSLLTVPALVGLTQESAEAALFAASYRVGNVTMQASDSVIANNIISQSPASGTILAADSFVDLVVSSGITLTTVPDVGGQDQNSATADIIAADLVLGVITMQSSDTVAAGLVISQSPAAAASAAIGSAVDIVISSGPAAVIVPDVIGQNQTDATTALTTVGLNLGVITMQSSDTVAAGLVISQSPAASASVAAGSQVDLVISSGPALVTVPDVGGQPQASAEAAIIAAGLQVGTVSTLASNTIAAGDVISQSPAPGASVMAGSAVNISVSTGPDLINPPITGSARAIPTLSFWGLLALSACLSFLGINGRKDKKH